MISKNPTINQWMDTARHAAQEGRYGDVIQALESILAEAPFHTEANAHLAWIFSQDGEYRRALPHYGRLIAGRPWLWQAYPRGLQCLWFLCRRKFHRIAEKWLLIRHLYSRESTFSEFVVQVFTRLLEIIQRKDTIITAWMAHHRHVRRLAEVNSYEYYKIMEIRFAMAAIQQRKPVRILDMGCGQSGFPSFLAAQGYCVVSLDLDWSGLRVQAHLAAQCNPANLCPAEGNFLSPPFSPGCFDAITIISSIEHIPGDGDQETLRAIVPLLRPGGSLIITVPAAAYASDQWTRHRIGHVYEESSSRKNAQGFLRIYNPETLRERLILPSGLTAIRVAYWGETTSWGWQGLGRNFIDHRGVIHPSPFLAPLGMLFGRELPEEELMQTQWAVACIELRKPA